MSATKRVQMTRNKPWRAEHPDAVIVDRRTKWGNPFKVGDRFVNRAPAHRCPYPTDMDVGYRERRDAWTGEPYTERVDIVSDAKHAVALFRKHIRYEDDHWDPFLVRNELRGRDLACWCKLGEPCHADVLLELANR